MFFTNKFINFKKFYIFFFIFVLFINTKLTAKLYANTFKINEIEVSEDFDLNFDKKKVFDKAFRLGFEELIFTILKSEDIKKIEKINLSKIKSLVDTFDVVDEKFVEDQYIATFSVNFNKNNSFDYLESQNIFPSIPKKIDILLLPILIENKKEEIIFFGENELYKQWSNYKQKYHLLNYILPSQDLEDTEFLKKNIEFIEDYKFEEIIKKYDLNNFIILIIQKNENEMNILSKMQFNEVYKIFNVNYPNINFKDDSEIAKLIIYLKTIYEDEWKNLNLINTSINLPITVSLSSEDNDRIILFEETLKDLDFVANYSVLSFNSENIVYKVIFNGSPNKFFSEIKNVGFYFEKNNQIWKVR